MKFPLVNVCELVFGVNVFDLDFGVPINSVKQPVQNNSVGSGYMSHCGNSAFYYHLNHGFIVPKNVVNRTKSRRLHDKRNVINITQQDCGWLDLHFGFGCAGLMWCHATSLVLDLWFSLIELEKSGILP